MNNDKIRKIDISLDIYFTSINDDYSYEKIDRLFYLLVRSDMDKFKNMLLENMSLINEKNKCGMTFLHCAVKFENSEAIKFLLKYGANQKLHDNNGYSAVHYIIFTNSEENLTLLVKTLNTKTIDGDTLLHLAIQTKNYVLIDLLLTHKVDFNIKNKLGHTPFFYIDDDDIIIEKIKKINY